MERNGNRKERIDNLNVHLLDVYARPTATTWGRERGSWWDMGCD